MVSEEGWGGRTPANPRLIQAVVERENVRMPVEIERKKNVILILGATHQRGSYIPTPFIPTPFSAAFFFVASYDACCDSV